MIRRLSNRSVVLAAVVALLAAASGCGDDDDANGSDGFTVVVSTTIVADLVSQVAGEDVSVTSIVPSGADVHTFTLTPGDVRTVAAADLVVIIGASLGAIEDDLRDSASGPVLVLTDGMPLRPFPEGFAHDHEDEDDHAHEDEDDHAHEDEDDHAHEDEDDHVHEDEDGHAHGEFDPHFWMDADLSIQAVEAIRDVLSDVDPDGASGYRERASTYVAELRAVDAEVRDALAELPEERRYLVTFHDAYGYFADRYGLTIVGFVVEGPEEEPSAAQIAELVETIEELEIPYIYTEPQFSARVVEQIASDAGAEVRTIPSGSLADEYPTLVAFLREIAARIAA